MNMQQYAQPFLSILYLIYLLSNYELPEQVSDAIDTTLGKIVVCLWALFMIVNTNPLLGILSILVAYKMIRSAYKQSGISALKEYYPTEEKKWSPFTATNQFQYTLEQEMVQKMTTQQFNDSYVRPPFKPIIEKTYDAAFIK